MSWLSRIGNALRSGRMDRDLADEMEFHAAARRDEMMRRGVPAEEADRAVRRRLGNSLALREDSREVKAVSWLDSLMRDLRFGSRMLRKNPAVTLAALVSLSLAIGSWTAAFSLIDALMLRPLPVSHPESLVYLAYQAGGPSGSIDTLGTFFSFRELQLLRDAARGQADVFSRSSQQQHPVTFDSAEPDRVRVEFVSGGALDILGIRPALGRLLMPSDDQHPHESPVAVLSYDFWMRRFGGNPAVLGRWFADGDDRFQVVGVLQQGFTGVEPGVRTDIWAPNMMFSREAFTNPGWSWTNILARMRPGASPERLRQMMQAAFEEQRRVEPKRLFPKLIVRSARSGPSSLRETFARPLWILAAVVGLVLLIACSNVANLFLARAAAREREMALRISIGAGRARLVQQALAESGILAGAACICGLLLARAAAPSLVNLLTPANNPAYLDLHLSGRMLGFVSLVGAASTILFGLVPALRASAASPGDALKRGGGKLTPRKAMLRPLVAAQVSFSFMVLFVGGLLLLSFRTLITMDLGFTRTDVILADVEAKKRTGDAVQASRQWLDAVLRIPGVRAAGLSGFALLDGNIWWTDIQPPGSAQKTQYRLLDVSPEFFDTMKMRLVDGRSFDVRDLAPKSPSVVINQAFARLCCPGENPVGKHFWRNRDNYSVEKEVIGVVRDAKYDQLRPPGPPTVYLPLSDFGGALEVRTSVDPKLVLAGMERALDAIDPSVRVSRLRLQSTVIDDMLIPERLLAILATFFAAVALVLASVGLYGVLSYSVVRRRKEIGIRVALGAQRAIVMRLVASEIVLVTLAGLAVGLAGGWVLARLAATMLFSVKPSDTASLALPLGALLLAAALAALPPALRAAQVDPMAALREE